MPTIGFEISDQHTLLELAAEGLGLGVSTRATVQAWTERGIRTKAVQAMVRHAQGWAQQRDSARSRSAG